MGVLGKGNWSGSEGANLRVRNEVGKTMGFGMTNSLRSLLFLRSFRWC